MSVVVAYLACALIWGTTWFAIRVCIGVGGYPTYAAAALRFALASLVLGGLCWLGLARPGPRARRQIVWLVVAGLLNTVGYGLVYTAEERIPGGLAAVLYGTAPLLMAVLASLTRSEKVTAGPVACALVSLVGVFLLYRDRLEVSSSQAVGVAMVLGSVLISNTYNIIIKRHASDVHPLATTAVFLGVTTVAMTLFTLARGGRALPWPPPLKPTLALLYLGLVGSVVAFTSYFYLIKRVSLMTLSSLVFIQPLIALGADALWEKTTRLRAQSYLGVGITLVGVVLGILMRARAAPPEVPPAAAVEPT